MNTGEHQVLYRKYRPSAFEEVKGQEHITSVLEKTVEQGNISHAYLFAGSRGTGKTSVARIFATAIETTSHDIHEIDAASNRGIDDVRALREAVQTLPFESPYKVYIIDEVHMLTKEAFNALLKTLEEPPKHVIFILATTELEKLPDTIVSRCQTFNFKKPSQKILKDLAMEVAKKEGKDIEPAAAALVATLGDGSFRDMHGYLQKIFPLAEKKKITLEEVEQVTGAPSSATLNEVIEALAYKDTEKGIAALERAEEKNVDMRIFLRLLLDRLRGVLLVRFAPKVAERLANEFVEEDVAFFKKLATDKTATITSQTLLELLDASDRMRFAAVPRLPLELAVIELTKEKE